MTGVVPTARARRDDEPFRSRRFDRGHPAVGAGEVDLGNQAGSWHGALRDVSTRGLALLVADAPGGATCALDDAVSIRVAVDGREFLSARGTIRHVTDEQRGKRLGVELDRPVNLACLHRRGDEIVATRAWRAFAQEHPLPDLSTAEQCLTFLADYFEGADSVLARLEADVATVDPARRDGRGRALRDAFAPGFVSTMRVLRRTLGELLDADPRAIERLPSSLLDRVRRRYLTCPFARRAHTKPLGYAGDYELMQLLYRDDDEAGSALGDLLLRFHRSEPGGVAVRNRVPFLGAAIRAAVASHEQVDASQRLPIANIGCGGAVELIQLLRVAPELGARLHVALVDQDANALAACERALTPLVMATDCRIDYLCDPIARLIQARSLRRCLGPRWLVYSAGLFDYLDDEEFVALGAALLTTVVEGGTLLIGNMARHNPSRVLMTTFMQWDLVHRSADELVALGARLGAADDDVAVDAEATGVNLFLRLRRGVSAPVA